MIGMDKKDAYVEDEALEWYGENMASHFLQVIHASFFQSAKTYAWQYKSKFSELRVAPEEHKILLTETPLPKSQRKNDPNMPKFVKDIVYLLLYWDWIWLDVT